MPLIANDIPPVLPAAVQAALAGVALDRALLNDDTTDFKTLTDALTAAVGAGTMTQDSATALQNAYGPGPTGPIALLINDIPPVLQPKLFAAVQALALAAANLDDTTTQAAALLAEAQAEVGAGTLTKSAAIDLLAAYGVKYTDPVAQPAA